MTIRGSQSAQKGAQPGDAGSGTPALRSDNPIKSDIESTQDPSEVGREIVNPEDLPTISVVLATRHRASMLPPLIEAVLSDPGTLEVIVVVDGLDDSASVDVLSRWSETNGQLSYLCQEQAGQMKALQQGVLMARGEVVLLLDDDVLPISPLATGHARAHRDHDNLVIVGSMPVTDPHGARLGVASRLYSKAYEAHCQALLTGDVPVLDYLWMGNISVRRDRCLAVGVNSASYSSTYYTDREFGYRLADAGLVGIFDPSIRAVHLHARSPDAFLRDAYRQGSGLEMLYRLYPERLGPFSPRLVVEGLPNAAYIALSKISEAGWTPVTTARILLRIGLFGGRVNLDAIETNLAKRAQHLMQWHGAKVALNHTPPKDDEDLKVT
jgi:glycosyltransferase involved in cell wall biosynthesis